MGKKLLLGAAITLVTVAAIGTGIYLDKIEDARSGGGADIDDGQSTRAEVQIDPDDGWDFTLTEELQDALSSYTFYKGYATIYETQKWTSYYDDKSHGEGDAIFNSEEILIYDESAGKLYILARTMDYESEHLVTVNDPNGNFLSFATVKGWGNLTEHYVMPYVFDGKINLIFNPCRVYVKSNTIFTLPKVWKSEWVTYLSTAATTRMGDARVFLPDDLEDINLLRIPDINNFTNSKGYNKDEIYVYEATDRFFVPVGTFVYSYTKVDYEEIEDELQLMMYKCAADISKLYLNKHYNPATIAMHDLTNEVANGNYTGSILENGLESLDSSGDFKPDISETRAVGTMINQLQSSISKLQSEDGVTRSLENFVMEASGDKKAGSEQREMINQHKVFEELFMQALAGYKEKLNELAKDPGSQQLRKEIRKINTHLQEMVSDFRVVFYELGEQEEEASAEEQAAAMNTVYRLWIDNLNLLLGTGGVSRDVDLIDGVDLPQGYPQDIVAIVKNAIVVAAESFIDEDTGKNGYGISLKTNQDQVEVFNYYKQYFAGVPDLETVTFNNINTLSGEKKGYAFSVMIMANMLGGNEKTVIQIVLNPI